MKIDLNSILSTLDQIADLFRRLASVVLALVILVAVANLVNMRFNGWVPNPTLAESGQGLAVMIAAIAFSLGRR